MKAATRCDSCADTSELRGFVAPVTQVPVRRTDPAPANLHPTTWAALQALGERRWFSRGEVLLRAEDPAGNLLLIVCGKVKATLASREGEDALGMVLGRGEILGLVSLLDGGPQGMTATAIERTEIITLRREALEHLVTTNATVALDVYGLLARQLRRSYTFLEDTVSLDVAGRIAKRLLELADSYGEKTEDGILIDLPLTQLELATMVGVTRETVNKHLGAYRSRGIIDIRDHRILIRRSDALRRRIY